MHPLSLFPKPKPETQKVHAPFETKHTHSCLSLHLLPLTWQSLEDLSLLLFSPRYLQLHLAQAKSVLDSSYEEDAFSQSRCGGCGCTRVSPICLCTNQVPAHTFRVSSSLDAHANRCGGCWCTKVSPRCWCSLSPPRLLVPVPADTYRVSSSLDAHANMMVACPAGTTSRTKP